MGRSKRITDAVVVATKAPFIQAQKAYEKAEAEAEAEAEAKAQVAEAKAAAAGEAKAEAAAASAEARTGVQADVKAAPTPPDTAPALDTCRAEVPTKGDVEPPTTIAPEAPKRRRCPRRSSTGALNTAKGTGRQRKRRKSKTKRRRSSSVTELDVVSTAVPPTPGDQSTTAGPVALPQTPPSSPPGGPSEPSETTAAARVASNSPTAQGNHAVDGVGTDAAGALFEAKAMVDGMDAAVQHTQPTAEVTAKASGTSEPDGGNDEPVETHQKAVTDNHKSGVDSPAPGASSEKGAGSSEKGAGSSEKGAGSTDSSGESSAGIARSPTSVADSAELEPSQDVDEGVVKSPRSVHVGEATPASGLPDHAQPPEETSRPTSTHSIVEAQAITVPAPPSATVGAPAASSANADTPPVISGHAEPPSEPTSSAESAPPPSGRAPSAESPKRPRGHRIWQRRTSIDVASVVKLALAAAGNSNGNSNDGDVKDTFDDKIVGEGTAGQGRWSTLPIDRQTPMFRRKAAQDDDTAPHCVRCVHVVATARGACARLTCTIAWCGSSRMDDAAVTFDGKDGGDANTDGDEGDDTDEGSHSSSADGSGSDSDDTFTLNYGNLPAASLVVDPATLAAKHSAGGNIDTFVKTLGTCCQILGVRVCPRR